MTTRARVLDAIDLTDPERFRQGFPHDDFAILREQAPVWWHPEHSGTDRLGGSFWVVSKHADVQAVYLAGEPVMAQYLPTERSKK